VNVDVRRHEVFVCAESGVAVELSLCWLDGKRLRTQVKIGWTRDWCTNERTTCS